MPAIEVEAIPAFADNYIWLIHTGGTECALVDPGDAGPVAAVLRERGLRLAAMLVTHHHADHIGGLRELRRAHAPVVFGPADPRIAEVDIRLGEGEIARLPALGLQFRVLEVPGHTASHIAYYGHGCLFCGDTLFSVGCGRLFEGTPQQMQESLDKLARLDPSTRVFCAHEYTLSNCRFAVQVEPDNVALQQRLREVQDARTRGERTVPSRLGEELAVNPFLRSRAAGVVAAARKRDPRVSPGAATLQVIRAWKDGH